MLPCPSSVPDADGHTLATTCADTHLDGNTLADQDAHADVPTLLYSRRSAAAVSDRDADADAGADTLSAAADASADTNAAPGVAGAFTNRVETQITEETE